MKKVLYSTHCPKCMMLENILKKENIDYEVCTDVDKMLSMGIQSVPMLGVGDKLMDYDEAVKEIHNLA